MPYGAHETMEVHEILNEKINMINHFGMYAQMVQDRQLRQMIERHMQTAMQSYDQLVGYTHDYNAASGMQRPYGMPSVQPQNIQYGLRNPMDQAPQTQQSQMNDQQILGSLLSCHKNSARNHMHASLECADPNIRQMLINGAVTCANQAYECFILMNQQGYYQVPTMNDHTAKAFLHSYQPMNESMMTAGQQGQGQRGYSEPGSMQQQMPAGSMGGMGAGGGSMRSGNADMGSAMNNVNSSNLQQ
ncbi:spore coat protein [Gorillibacterium sp. sgz5001074]|uniref:spore coat protein n=1 Tax=Gorillibacterium sp. sgz5001074 TaxID=3446695 RepID=UPI003F67DCC9